MAFVDGLPRSPVHTGEGPASKPIHCDNWNSPRGGRRSPERREKRGVANFIYRRYGNV
jgi:hypothetical protein